MRQLLQNICSVMSSMCIDNNFLFPHLLFISKCYRNSNQTTCKNGGKIHCDIVLNLFFTGWIWSSTEICSSVDVLWIACCLIATVFYAHFISISLQFTKMSIKKGMESTWSLPPFNKSCMNSWRVLVFFFLFLLLYKVGGFKTKAWQRWASLTDFYRKTLVSPIIFLYCNVQIYH